MGIRWYFTEKTLKVLRDLATNKKMNFTRAAKALGTTGDLIRAKASEAGYEDELNALYPPTERQWTTSALTGIRKLKAEDIGVPLEVDRNHIYVRSAAMPWREVA
ncbi:MAG: hypothetical protein CMP20_12325 [Rickettsiales bacterium]|nr:hypothetical protein [Rickettsiales bacterium]